MATCKGCDGTGNCSRCGGSGTDEGFVFNEKCSKCDGSGNCTVCDGTGQTDD